LGCEDTFFGESDFRFADSPFELDDTFKWRLLIFSSKSSFFFLKLLHSYISYCNSFFKVSCIYFSKLTSDWYIFSFLWNSFNLILKFSSYYSIKLYIYLTLSFSSSNWMSISWCCYCKELLSSSKEIIFYLSCSVDWTEEVADIIESLIYFVFEFIRYRYLSLDTILSLFF
jgi:hypothetical protein